MKKSTPPLLADSADFAAAVKSVAGVRELVDASTAAGLTVLESWRWKTGSRNAVGRVRVEDRRGTVLFSTEWDVGAGRPPATNFRLKSRHGQALIAALAFVRNRLTRSAS